MHVARVVVSLVVHAVVGLTLGLIAHVVVVVFVVAILHRIFLYGRYTLYTKHVGYVDCACTYHSHATIALHVQPDLVRPYPTKDVQQITENATRAP